MNYFTSDTHFGDDRLGLFARDLVADSSEEIDRLIIQNWNRRVKEEDTVYHLGDVAMSKEKLKLMKELNGEKILIRGNYDEDYSDDEFLEYFREVHQELFFDIKWDDGTKETLYFNHYPKNYKPGYFFITAHIHGLWKVQKNMINVGTDAWHFTPISEDELKFYIDSDRNVYDENVFVNLK